MSSLNKCVNCGCEDSFLTTPAPCPTSAGCPTPEPCYSVTDSRCTIYTGPDIVCGEDVIVETNTNVNDALQALAAYFCQL